MKATKILIVEDDKILQKYLEKILVKWATQRKIAIEVECVGTKEGAEAFLRNNQVDLVLLDIMLGTNKDAGQEIARNVSRGAYRSSNKPSDVEPKIIMLTARTSPADVIEAGRSNVADYIAKPFNRDVLLKKIEHVLGLVESKDTSFFQDIMRRV